MFTLPKELPEEYFSDTNKSLYKREAILLFELSKDLLKELLSWAHEKSYSREVI